MLRITTSDHRLRRRDFLTVGGLGCAGAALSTLLAGRSLAGPTADLLTGRSVILLFQQGGPSQHETFDPKPLAPDGVRTVTGTVSTSLPGVQFGDGLASLAPYANRLAIVRSFQTNNNGHNLEPIVGATTQQANLGAYFSRVAGPTRADSGLPNHAVLFPDAVDNEAPKSRARGDISATGTLGAAHAPFIPGGGGQLQRDMRLNLPIAKFSERRHLAEQLDTLREQLEDSTEYARLDELQQQAYQVLLSGGVSKALDLAAEDAATVQRYDTRRYAHRRAWNKVARGVAGMYWGHAQAIGKQLLLARRLCEAGCGYVTIRTGYDGVWDMHADGNNLNMVDGMEAVGPAFAHAVAAFIEDVESRGLSDRILLVAVGEMGRTPRLNKGGGRDHWGKLAPLLLYGGGIAGGQVVGQSTRDGGEPSADPLTPKHLIATILQTLFHAGRLRLAPGLADVSRLADHPPIPLEFHAARG